MFKILTNIKNLFIHIRKSLKLIFLLFIATAIIIGIISLAYKPMYAVTLDGKFIGYTESKINLQNKINEYIENGEKDYTAFVDIEKLPEYSLCLLKKDKKSNDTKILETVKSTGKTYYKYYAILEGTTEKYYVGTKEEAENIINKLKEKKSGNINSIAYSETHSEELKEFSNEDKIITALYKKQKTRTIVASTYSTYTGTQIASNEGASGSVLGISLTRPVGGVITSRFRERSRPGHTGLDIAAPVGTVISAASSGTVVYSGNAGTGYGNFIKISHGNGVETLYAHCNTLYVQEGAYVTAGQAIATVGNTGNSTGSHLHFEVRINGTATNPQSYIY